MDNVNLQSTTPHTRRKLLGSIAGSGLVAVAGCSENDSTQSSTPESESGTGEEDSNLESESETGEEDSNQDGDKALLEHYRGGSEAKDDGMVASNILLNARNVSIGERVDRQLRITDGDGRSVTVVPEEQEQMKLDGAFGFSIYDGTGSIYDGTDTFATEPSISPFGDDTEILVEIAGDTSMFHSGPIFSSYIVELLEGDRVIASTDERIYGIGYPIGFTQDGTSGEIEVTIAASEEVKDSWNVILEVVNNDLNGDMHVQVTSEFEREGDQFVTTFDSTNIDPLSEGGFRLLEIKIYADGVSTSEQPNLWFTLPAELDGSDDETR